MVLLVRLEIPEVVIPVKMSIIVHQRFEANIVGSSSSYDLHMFISHHQSCWIPYLHPSSSVDFFLGLLFSGLLPHFPFLSSHLLHSPWSVWKDSLQFLTFCTGSSGGTSKEVVAPVTSWSTLSSPFSLSIGSTLK